MKRLKYKGFGSQARAFIQKVKKKAVYLSVMGGVLDRVTPKVTGQLNGTPILSYSTAAYFLGFGIIILSIFIVRLMVRYYNKMNYDVGLNEGMEVGKEELLIEQEMTEKEKEKENEAELEEELEEEKVDIDYEMVIDDIDKYTESLGDEDKDQPLVQNINKFVTGYKFLKPPDVAVLSMTKRFDEYEVSIALPEERKGASKISEFIPFEEKTRKEIQDEFDSTAQLNNSMVGMPNMGGMGSIITSRLDSLGKKISDSFIPENVMKNLQSIDDPIIIETNDGEILWETIHDGNNFIALEHPIGRVLKTKEEARVNEFERGEKLRFLLIGNPTGDLESTEKEVNYIETILKQKVIINKLMGDEATKENILKALTSGQYDVIHYAGHADSESEGEAALLASDGKLFSSEIKSSLQGRPYVYLNACGSGKESMDESKDTTQVSDTEGLASAFILGGAIGFMGAMWRLPDKSAAEFSVSFYEGLIENLKVGEACKQARLALKKQNLSDITWAAFLQYGDPVQRLREKKTEKDKEIGTEDDVEEDAEIEVVEDDEYEKSLEEEDDEVPAEEELTDEERLNQYQGWLMGGLEHLKNKKYEDAITAFDSAIGLDSDRYNAWHLTGNALRELRRYNEALECYDKAIERDATIDELWYDKALALGAIGRFDEAMDCKQTVESLKLGRVKEWLKKANELLARGGVSDAIEIYDRILKENRKYPLAWYLKGIAYTELKEFEKAIKCYDTSLKYAKNFSKSYQKKAELLFQLEKYNEALKNIDSALKMNPLNEEALILKSDILTNLKRYRNAFETINQILAINKTHANALLRKADILRHYNKNKKSLKCYDEVIKLNPKNQEAWFWRSQLINKLGLSEDDELECIQTLMEMDVYDQSILQGVSDSLTKKEGLFEEKLKWSEKMIMYNPNDISAWLNKGNALNNLNRHEEASKAFNKVLELDKDNKEVLLVMGKIFQKGGEVELAAENYKRVIDIEPTNTDALLSLSGLQKDLGKYREALHGYSKLFKIMPGNIKILENLRELYFELGQIKNALVISNKLLKLNPNHANYQYAHVKLLHNNKNYPEVINFTDKLIGSMPDDNNLLIMRAEAYTNLDELDKAIECWDQIIELKSNENSKPPMEPPEQNKATDRQALFRKLKENK